MVRRISLKILPALLLICTLAAFFSAAVSAKGGELVFDEMGYMTAEEAQKLNEKALGLSKKHGADIVVVTAAREFDMGRIACEKYGFDMNDHIVMLVISKDGGTYYYDLYTYPVLSDAVSNKEVSRLLDARAVYDNIKGGNIYAGADAFVSKAAKAYSGTLWGNPVITVLVGSLVFALIMTTITFSIIASYKKKMRSANYPLDRYTKLDLTHRNDVFLGSSVTRVRINTSSSGSRGGSGGGFSGGGGGSGHRGGR